MLYVGILIFVAVFYCIITEKIPSAWATMAGGLLMTLIGIINQEEVLETVYNRLEILFLLVGMMIIGKAIKIRSIPICNNRSYVS